MSELANYSIETDHTVLLAFHDGRRLRVPVGQLPNHLTPPDLAKVHEAIKLRRDFIRQHMPKAALILVAGGLIALLAVGGRAVADLMTHPRPVPASPGHTGVVRSQTLPTQAVSPAPQPAVQGNTTVAAVTTTTTHVVRPTVRRVPSPKSLPLVVPSPLSSPTLSPAPSPSPVPSASPTPSPSPEPQSSADQVANDHAGNGNVLGCSTTDPMACDGQSITPTIP